MNSIRIDVRVDDLSYLPEVAQDTYEIKVFLLDSEGEEIVDPNLPTSPFIALVETTSNEFPIFLPIADANYPINATLKVRGIEECCTDEQEINLTNTENEKVSIEAVILNGLYDNKIHAYEPSTGILREIGPTVTSPDIAHTENKLWVYNTPTAEVSLRQFDFKLDPLSISNEKVFLLPITVGGTGLCAESDTKIYLAGNDVNEIDLSGETPVITKLFTFGNQYRCAGDLIYDVETELFLISYFNSNLTPEVYKLGVFTKSGTVLRSVTTSIPNIFGIYQYEGQTYVVADSGAIYTLDLNTLATSPTTTLSVQIAGASQIPSQISIPL